MSNGRNNAGWVRKRTTVNAGKQDSPWENRLGKRKVKVEWRFGEAEVYNGGGPSRAPKGAGRKRVELSLVKGAKTAG